MPNNAVVYDIKLNISYSYDNSADASRQIIRLMPLDLPGEQRLNAGSHFVSPKADEWIERTDFFRNRFVELAFLHAHHEIDFTVKARVQRFAPQRMMVPAMNLVNLQEEIDANRSLEAWAPHHFLNSSPRVPIDVATTTYAASLAFQNADALAIVDAIGKQLYCDMKYDPEATTVDTPMIEAFNTRQGVCQDFSHIMIACLRGVGIPAAYVSGFLCTTPPPGKPRLEGADAMHAWVRAWCGEDLGWIEYDPTNGIFAGVDHIVVARGRDYSDIAPIKGVMRSFGKHSSQQALDVVPVVINSEF
ncbi:MAG: transglutaminase family protein [Aestuariivirga sp.]